MRRQELSGSVQRGGRFVEDRVIGLEDVSDRHLIPVIVRATEVG
jgi:hypothetical protein